MTRGELNSRDYRRAYSQLRDYDKEVIDEAAENLLVVNGVGANSALEILAAVGMHLKESGAVIELGQARSDEEYLASIEHDLALMQANTAHMEQRSGGDYARYLNDLYEYLGLARGAARLTTQILRDDIRQSRREK